MTTPRQAPDPSTARLPETGLADLVRVAAATRADAATLAAAAELLGLAHRARPVSPTDAEPTALESAVQPRSAPRDPRGRRCPGHRNAGPSAGAPGRRDVPPAELSVVTMDDEDPCRTAAGGSGSTAFPGPVPTAEGPGPAWPRGCTQPAGGRPRRRPRTPLRRALFARRTPCPRSRVLFRTLALAGTGRIDEALAELRAGTSTDSDDAALDQEERQLLGRFQNPPLPGLNQILLLLDTGRT